MVSYEDLSKMLVHGAELIKMNEEKLCRLDSNIGDGDHGVGMAKIASIIKDCCEKNNVFSPGKLVGTIGDTISERVGGSSGMLWGTFFSGMSLDLETRRNIEKEYFVKMFLSGFEELIDISGAEIGDKTMMDALIPAYNVFVTSSGSEKEILQEAAKASDEGARKTADYVAKYGRAKNLKERAIGFEDAGAVSAAMMISAWAEAI